MRSPDSQWTISVEGTATDVINWPEFGDDCEPGADPDLRGCNTRQFYSIPVAAEWSSPSSIYSWTWI